MALPIESEETLIIETPERVPLAFALASIGNRFIAVAIDHIIQFVAVILLIVIFGIVAGANIDLVEDSFKDTVGESPKWVVALLILVVFLLFAGYFVFFEWIWNGQTPGKRLMKLRVLREDGRPITFWEALARNLIRLFDTFPGFVIPVYSVGLIAIFMNSRDQRVGDFFAGTVVVRERQDEAPTFEQVFANPTADAALRRARKRTEFVADIKPLTEQEIEVAETFLRRRWDLSDKQRTWMAWRVALPIMYKIKPSYDLQTFTYEGFLEELVHRYHSGGRLIG